MLCEFMLLLYYERVKNLYFEQSVEHLLQEKGQN